MLDFDKIPSVPPYVAWPTCVFAGLFLLRKFREAQWGWVRSTRDMTGKCVIVTGANCGLGEATAFQLAKRNARVVLACRDVDKARAAIERIRGRTSSGQLVPMKVDLKSLASVRKFCSDVAASEPRIDVLICNAGVSIPPEKKERTEDGLEVHFGVNHLGHFVMVNELLDVLKSSAPSRIVVVASSLYTKGQAMFNAEDEASSEYRKGLRNSLYCDSKMANVLFVRGLAKRLEGTGVTAYAVCPGWTRTSLFRHSEPNYSIFQKLLFTPVIFWFMRWPVQGAQTIIHCAIAEEVEKESGKMYKDVKEFELIPYALDDNLAKRFWDYSQRLVDERT